MHTYKYAHISICIHNITQAREIRPHPALRLGSNAIWSTSLWPESCQRTSSAGVEDEHLKIGDIARETLKHEA